MSMIEKDAKESQWQRAFARKLLQMDEKGS